MEEKSPLGSPVKEKKGKVVTLEMSFEKAKSKYLKKYPLRLTELWRENKEENTMLIMDQESAETFKFNISALEMWKMCNGDHTVEDIVQHTCTTMDNAHYETVLQDTLGFFMTLEKLDLLGWKDD
ncbi:MAG: PqqD family protein [Theionarchaea archaeon]|nr:PqqD family protein [Theionarchaea archaeon]